MKFEDAISEIKRRANIAQVIGRYVKLKQRGLNWLGLCPFHQEKTPSFNVRPDKGFYKCFGCGASGDVFSFMEQHTGQPFVEVAKQLAEEVGIEISFKQKTTEELTVQVQQKKLQEALSVAQTYFQQQLRLPQNTPAAQYLLKERKLPGQTIEHWQLGFGGTDDSLLIAHLKQQQVDDQTAFDLGLLRDGSYGRYGLFSRRITVPIRDVRGHVVGFGGRIFGSADDKRPKYVNSPASPVYDKSAILFGLFESLPFLKNGRPAVIVEGYFDAIAVHRVGFAAVAPCGTSLTEQHIEALSRLTKKIILAFDQDDAGKTAHKRALLMLLRQGFQVFTIEMGKKDPDALVCAGGANTLKALLTKPKDALQALILSAMAEGSAGMAARIGALEALVPYLASVQSPLAIGQYVRYAARVFQEDESTLRREVTRQNPKVRFQLPLSKNKPQSREKVAWSYAERQLLFAAVRQPRAVMALEESALAEMNPDLRAFMTELLTLVRGGTGEFAGDILRNVPVAKDSSVIPLLVTAQGGLLAMPAGIAEEIVRAFNAKVLAKRYQAKIVENREDLALAEERGDLGQMRSALLNQSTQLKELRDGRLHKPAAEPFDLEWDEHTERA